MGVLETIHEAQRALKVSRSFLYRLPPGTPGVYTFGRSKRFCVEELRAWANQTTAEKEASNAHHTAAR